MSLQDVGRQVVTGPDNTTHDMARWLGILSALTAMGLTVYSVIAKDSYVWSITDFGIGMGSLFTGTGILIKAKEGSEPSATQ